MPTSGSVDHSITAENLIFDALLDIGGIEEGEAITGEHTTYALRQLNNLLKWVNTLGPHQWATEEGILFLDGASRSYILPTAKSAKGEFGYTTLSADEASGQTVLSVTATAPGSPLPTMLASDQIGIQLADGTRQWTTVSSVDSATQVTVADALTGDASSGATVFWYTTGINRPVRVLSARRGLYNGAEVPCEVVSRDEYFEQPQKDTTGQPTLAYYQPLRTTGEMFVWPKGSVTTVLRFTYERLIEDIDTTSDEIDVPPEWFTPLQDMLAARLAPQYGLSLPERQECERKALTAQAQIEAWGTENNPMRFQMGW